MTREIKFRYWDTKRNQMVGWESIKTFCRFGAVERMKHQIFQQYTGLKDKNGKEIYEGDIDTDEHGNLNVVCYIKKYGAYCFVPLELYVNEDYENEVMYEYGYDCFFHNIVPSEFAEIIGNIYENPELLEWKE